MTVSFFLDRMVLELVRRANLDGWRGDFSRMLQSFKEFGQPVAIAVAFLLIFALDKPRRRMLPRLLLCVLLPLVLIYPLRLSVHRLRPRRADDYNTVLGRGFFLGQEPGAPLLAFSLPGQGKIVVDGKLSSSDKQSFPSAHTATAFAFAVGLSGLYPAGQLVFYGLAVGCGSHRILFGTHWLSDVAASVFIGLLVSRAAWRWRKKTPGETGG